MGKVTRAKVSAGKMVELLAILIAMVLFGCRSGSVRREATGNTSNLLFGLAPVRAQGVRNAERLTDGRVAIQGDEWNTDLTAVFSSGAAFVEYDLGASTRITAGYLQGDNNDQYVVSVSDDGRRFSNAWRAQPEGRSGLRGRSTAAMNVSGRYLRISAIGGDGAYSLTEVQLFENKPAVFPPQLPARLGIRPGETLRSKVLVFALALISLVLLSSRGARWWWNALWTLPVIAAGADFLTAFFAVWPPEMRDVSMVRAVTAAVAAAAVAREAFAPKRFAASRPIIIGTLGLCAVGAVAAFFNLGRPQFWDHKRDQPTFIHPFDMRVYFPVAKYFQELRFDGVYLASVAAFQEDDQRQLRSRFQRAEMRDLKTHAVTTVDRARIEIDAVKNRFSPQRWTEFKDDMRYFRQTMGPADYMGSLTDHGGNATPVWIAIAHVIFAKAPASDLTLGLAALLDPILLLFTFVMIGWTFGVRTALVSAVVFGANDFYMFGSDWAGATLRHDWMAYLGLAACALRREQWVLGGALLALSSLIRAFPALGLAATLLPGLWWIWEYRKQHRKFPGMSLIRRAQRPLERIFLGATVCVLAWVLISSLMFRFEVWGEWLHKVSMLNRDPHVNHVSLRALVAGSDAHQFRTMQERMPLFIVGLIVCIGAVVLASRGKRPEQACMFGLFLIAVVFYPANYYIHFVFLLPLVANEISEKRARTSAEPGLKGGPPIDRTDAGAWMSLLGICVAQYYTVLESDTDLHFQMSTAIFFAGMAVWFGLLIHRDFDWGAFLALAGLDQEDAQDSKLAAAGGPDVSAEAVSIQAEPPAAPPADAPDVPPAASEANDGLPDA
jgi:hypothetical protein